jgi:uncharacterized protein (DUF1778 family)
VPGSAPAKSRRFEGRLDPESDRIIARAAALTGQSKAAFMVQSARAAADRVIGRADVTLMPADQFDALVESLGSPQPLPSIERALTRPRAFRAQ